MQSVIEHKSGLIFSIKTFRPLWIFPWMSSIWRQFPMRTSIATVRFAGRKAAKSGHRDLCNLLKDLEVSGKMSEPFLAIEAYAKKKIGQGVKSYRIYPGHETEGKMTVRVKPKRRDE